MDDRRRYPRMRTLKAGKIVFHQRFSVVDCTIRNISEGGACLQVGATAGIPDRFELRIEQERVTKPCCTAWRTDRRIGVSFQQA